MTTSESLSKEFGWEALAGVLFHDTRWTDKSFSDGFVRHLTGLKDYQPVDSWAESVAAAHLIRRFPYIGFLAVEAFKSLSENKSLPEPVLKKSLSLLWSFEAERIALPKSLAFKPISVGSPEYPAVMGVCEMGGIPEFIKSVPAFSFEAMQKCWKLHRAFLEEEPSLRYGLIRKKIRSLMKNER